MSKFYGQVQGQASTNATRRGNREIAVSAQSWSGSLITRLNYDDNDELIVTLCYSETSSAYGSTVFHGTMKELLEKLGGGQ